MRERRDSETSRASSNKNELGAEEAVKQCLSEAFVKVFGDQPVQSIGDFIRAKSPFFGATVGKVEALQDKLGTASVEELKKDITEIEDNMTDNLDVVLEAVEGLVKAIDTSRRDMTDALVTQINSAAAPMKFISESKFQETVDSVVSTKAANKQLTEVSKRLVKENILLAKECKSLKEKLAAVEKDISEMKVKESKSEVTKNLPKRTSRAIPAS